MMTFLRPYWRNALLAGGCSRFPVAGLQRSIVHE